MTMNDNLIERVYALHGDVVRKLMRKGVDISEAPDIAVGILLDAVEHIHQLKNPDKLEAWVMAIAENGANRYLRERAKRWEKEISTVSDMETGEEIDIYDILADEMTVEKILRHAENTAMLGELLSCLGEKERIIFLMRNLEGMKFKEIAKTLNLNENTVRSIHSRCCGKLRKQSDRIYGKEAYRD